MIEKELAEDEEIGGALEESLAEWDAVLVEGLGELLVFEQAKVEAEERNLARLQKKYGGAHPLTDAAAAAVEAHRAAAERTQLERARAATAEPAARPNVWTVHGYVYDAAGYFRLRVENPIGLPAEVRVGVSAEFADPDLFVPEAGTVDYAEIVAGGAVEPLPDAPPQPGGRDARDARAADRIPTGVGFRDWIVTGRVTAAGAGVAGLRVRVFDRDLGGDDALGATATDANGVYRLIFKDESFNDFGENYPELYLIIEDAAGRCLFDGRRTTKTRAGRIELLDIDLGSDPPTTGKTKEK